jgi:hypothetical protein
MHAASFKGGLTGKAKTIAIGIKAMRKKGKKKMFDRSLNAIFAAHKLKPQHLFCEH